MHRSGATATAGDHTGQTQQAQRSGAGDLSQRHVVVEHDAAGVGVEVDRGKGKRRIGGGVPGAGGEQGAVVVLGDRVGGEIKVHADLGPLAAHEVDRSLGAAVIVGDQAGS